MKKKLLVIPMRNQYEQQLNAAALKNMGVAVIKNLNEKYDMEIASWLENKSIVDVNYPNITTEIIDRIILNHANKAEFLGIRNIR